MSDKIEINRAYIEELTSLIVTQNSKELISRIEELHIADIAEIIEDLSLENAKKTFTKNPRSVLIFPEVVCIMVPSESEHDAKTTTRRN